MVHSSNSLDCSKLDHWLTREYEFIQDSLIGYATVESFLMKHLEHLKYNCSQGGLVVHRINVTLMGQPLEKPLLATYLCCVICFI